MTSIGTDQNATHQRLHAGVAATIDVYAALSHTYASQGEARLALLSLWTADVLVLQSLLWESGLGAAPDPDAQLAAVGAAVDTSLRSEAEAEDQPGTVSGTLKRARAALMSTFDASVHAMLWERFVSAEHLDGLHLAPAEATRLPRDLRLGGRSVHELSDDLRVAAADCMAVSTWMARAGLPVDALAQARQADLASFEAYLVEAATAVGDDSLATVDLRWDIAMSAVAGITDAPEALLDAVHQVRDVLLAAVGPAEVDALRARFEPVRLPAA
jgi:hypothetical protein